MCLGIPGKVIDIWEESGTRMSTVDFGGTTKTVCLAYLPDMEIGEYTIVHAGFALTRLDVLAQFDRVKICVAYELDGERIHALPPSLAASARVQPVYEELPGWKTEITDVRKLGDLPTEARQYVRRIEEILGVPVDMISVGPERDQAIVTRDIFGSALL